LVWKFVEYCTHYDTLLRFIHKSPPLKRQKNYKQYEPRKIELQTCGQVYHNNKDVSLQVASNLNIQWNDIYYEILKFHLAHTPIFWRKKCAYVFFSLIEWESFLCFGIRRLQFWCDNIYYSLLLETS